jgi:hypothetical protein
MYWNVQKRFSTFRLAEQNWKVPTCESYWNVLKRTETYWNVLKFETCRNVLKCTETYWNVLKRTEKRTETYWNVLKRTETYWNVPKHPDRKNGINLISSRYHWDQLDAKVIVLVLVPVRILKRCDFASCVEIDTWTRTEVIFSLINFLCPPYGPLW